VKDLGFLEKGVIKYISEDVRPIGSFNGEDVDVSDPHWDDMEAIKEGVFKITKLRTSPSPKGENGENIHFYIGETEFHIRGEIADKIFSYAEGFRKDINELGLETKEKSLEEVLEFLRLKIIELLEKNILSSYDCPGDEENNKILIKQAKSSNNIRYDLDNYEGSDELILIVCIRYRNLFNAEPNWDYIDCRSLKDRGHIYSMSSGSDGVESGEISHEEIFDANNDGPVFELIRDRLKAIPKENPPEELYGSLTDNEYNLLCVYAANRTKEKGHLSDNLFEKVIEMKPDEMRKNILPG